MGQRIGFGVSDDVTVDSEAVLSRIRAAADAAGMWGALATERLVLDCELLLWSARRWSSSSANRPPSARPPGPGWTASRAMLETAASCGLEVDARIESTRRRRADVASYTDEYRRYLWPVAGVSDLRLAAFHLLASESGVHVDRDDGWHLERVDQLVAQDPDWFKRSGRLVVDVTDADSQAAGATWWKGVSQEQQGARTESTIYTVSLDSPLSTFVVHSSEAVWRNS